MAVYYIGYTDIDIYRYHRYNSREVILWSAAVIWSNKFAATAGILFNTMFNWKAGLFPSAWATVSTPD